MMIESQLAKNLTRAGAFGSGRWRGLWRIAVPLPALLIGIVAMRKHDVPADLWVVNLLVALIGTITCLALHFRWPLSPLTSKPRVALLVSIFALVATFYANGIENVHRWVNIGRFRLHVGSIVLPLILIALPAIEQSFVRCGFVVAITVLLAFQPDASQVTAFAIAAAVLLWKRRAVSMWGPLLLTTLVLIAWIRPDPLKPVPHVEEILVLAFSINLLVGLLGVVSLAALPLPFLASTQVGGSVGRMCLALGVLALAASARSAGKKYQQALTSEAGALQWFCAEPLVPQFARLEVQDASALDPRDLDVVFAAVESDAARELEPRFARTTPVVSTASAFRYENDVPIFIPGVNMDHAALLRAQQKNRGWKGFITPVPNCTTMGLAMTLKPLHESFGVRQVLMTSLQACSGAGRSPGVLSLDIVDNVIPYIPKEEEKVQRETQKILGKIAAGAIEPAAFPVSATCTRVPVLEGHTEAVFVALDRPATVEQAKAALQEFGKEFIALRHPSCPSMLIEVTDDPFRPQPRRDRDCQNGMVTTVGRLRVDPALPNGLKYVLVSHNTKMGAARGALLVGEHLTAKGYI